MCYNCGCNMPNDDMGNPNNITEATIRKAAEASNQPVEEAKKNMLALLKQQVTE